ncbi:NrfD/PsrC family molybdoenzyme membrane anchor subunit [Ferrimonas lipolytica]|uniref:Polysulfide reductase NrfD n=1 Tax=Ferrimonas lipolytica TaxID=2724191 RepID=A0A6H1UB92_9GAMM|nr:NrfD/PsrC family molybdoenzyme membrane anchor subunit [Ferrimonas lipolytica]QIZ75476.1 polysulfide reductase NrfD [Ferrimonas lipolytica]QIZ75481.1 polysulfide reductase NrfD [Ferrimonas lipolytica]
MTGIDFSTGLGGTVAWPWPIAVYLFFAGISGGALTIALMMRFYKNQTDNTPLLKGATVAGFVGIALGMLCLVLDLTNPLFFWKILVFYNFQSVMSLGVVVLMAFIPLSALLAAYALREELNQLPKSLHFILPVVDALVRFRRPLEMLTLVLAIAVCAYTGFLISALIRFPLINTSVLPALFVASGLSAGAAVAKVLAVKFFKEDLHSAEMNVLHKVEWPVMAVEALFIFMLFSSLIFGGSAGSNALMAFSGGVWTNLFWFGVVGLGFALPLLFSFGLGKKFAHSSQAFYMTSASVVCGMMCLRMFLLYAGQIYSI